MKRLAAVAFLLLCGAGPDPALEVARRSGVPAEQINQMLATCDATDVSQTALNFCAWRDLVLSENRLKALAAKARTTSQSCYKATNNRLKREMGQIDRLCLKEAADEYGGGSAEGYARMTCAAASQNALATKLSTAKFCQTR